MQLLIDLHLPHPTKNQHNWDEWGDDQAASSSEPTHKTWMRIVRRQLPGQEASDEPVHWPPWMRVNINDTVTIIGTGGVPARIAGHGEPIDVSRWVHSGTNYLGISNWPDATLTIAFVTTKSRTAKKLAERIVALPRQPFEQAKQRISNLVKGTGTGQAEVQILNTEGTASLMCPFSQIRIGTPARGKNCQHAQCFDLEAYLELNLRSKTSQESVDDFQLDEVHIRPFTTWRCPVCARPVSFRDLVVDSYMEKAIKEASETVEHINLSADGDWSMPPSKENTTASHSTSSTDPLSQSQDALGGGSVSDSDESSDGEGFAAFQREEREREAILANAPPRAPGARNPFDQNNNGNKNGRRNSFGSSGGGRAPKRARRG